MSRRRNFRITRRAVEAVWHCALESSGGGCVDGAAVAILAAIELWMMSQIPPRPKPPLKPLASPIVPSPAGYRFLSNLAEQFQLVGRGRPISAHRAAPLP